ncbi:MAG: DUF429 domain-containing protein [Chloroflexi bacterium]|nr:DUF429 domain-containing protein [Chloroflexota bacterium]
MAEGLAFLGLDLPFPPGSTRKPRLSAWALLDADRRLVAIEDALTDDDILALAASHHPRAIAIDAPLSCPRDPQAPYRAGERELLRRGIRLYPSGRNTFIRPLVGRGICLKAALEGEGHTVLEVYPYACFAVLMGCLPDKKARRAGREQRRDALAKQGISLEEGRSHHLLDAAVAAYTAYRWAAGEGSAVGDPDEGRIVLPAPALKDKYLKYGVQRSEAPLPGV